MHLSFILLLIVLVATCPLLADHPHYYHPITPHHGITSRINHQKPISIQQTLNNISPNESSRGAVVAAQSKSHPNYWYHWVRDSALVINTIVTLFEETNDNKYEQIIWDYIDFTNFTQFQKASRSSCEEDPMGYGEPKYNIDGTPFTEDWGRPQYDGIALRVSTLIRFAEIYLRRGGSLDRVHSILYRPTFPPDTVIKRDLEVIWKVFDKPGFDLWEETWGIHFYTLKVQHQALYKGYEFASQITDYGASEWYFKQSQLVLDKLDTQHWYNGKYLISTTRKATQLKPSNLDMATVLSILHTQQGLTDLDPYLATMYHLKISMQYAINSRYRPDLEPSIGRYSEDTYCSGNPWFLTTLAMSEVRYVVYKQYWQKGEIEITRVNQLFFEDLTRSKLRLGVQNWAMYTKIMHALFKSADSYLDRVHAHISSTGQMDEQIDKYTGYQISAKQLTWSHIAYLNTVRARDDALLGFLE